MDFRTPLAKAKGLGAAKTGFHHWWLQRLTAVALIFLIICLVFCSIKAFNTGGVEMWFLKLNSPFFALLVILFISFAIFHGYLGMKVIIEDYVHCTCMKTGLIILVNFVSVISAVAAILAVLYFHINSHTNEKAEGSSYVYNINILDKSDFV